MRDNAVPIKFNTRICEWLDKLDLIRWATLTIRRDAYDERRI